MSDRGNNSDYAFQRDDCTDDNSRDPDDKERDDKDLQHQTDKAGEYVRELLQEKLDLDSDKWPNSIRLIDQGTIVLGE